jgi:hypothetical protein
VEPLGPFSTTTYLDLIHTWADNKPGDAPYTLALTVTDKDDGVGSADVEVTVRNVAPIVDAGPDVSVTSGEVFAFSGSFSDPGLEDAPWSWGIHWSDGHTSSGSTDDQAAPIAEDRQVCEPGPYLVALTVTDKDGASGADLLTLDVPHFVVDVLVLPGGDPNPLNLRRGGLVPVAVLSTPTFDAVADLDPATVMLGDGAGDDTPVAQQHGGDDYANVEDVDGDGLMDLVLLFGPTATSPGRAPCWS